MPVIVRLQYCVIRMYFRDHAPPHFHVGTTAGNALVTIETLTVIEGKVNRQALREATEWAEGHRDVLRKVWKEYNP